MTGAHVPRSIRFHVWNTAGLVAWRVGVAITRGPVHRVGLALCGLSGSLDAKADRYG